MNRRIAKWTDLFDQRSDSEKILLAVLVLGVLVWLLWSLMYAPAAAETAALKRQLSNAESRLETLQLREQTALRASSEDPDVAARQRVARAIQDQEQMRERIDLLAGNLVPPATMTRLLTAILEDGSGLRLLRVENRVPQPLRDTVSNAGGEAGNSAEVYRHSLVLELEGEYLALITYLRRVESLGVVFFWDRVQYMQTQWPVGRVTLELHTLSSEEGFVGV